LQLNTAETVCVRKSFRHDSLSSISQDDDHLIDVDEEDLQPTNLKLCGSFFPRELREDDDISHNFKQESSVKCNKTKSIIQKKEYSSQKVVLHHPRKPTLIPSQKRACSSTSSKSATSTKLHDDEKECSKQSLKSEKSRKFRRPTTKNYSSQMSDGSSLSTSDSDSEVESSAEPLKATKRVAEVDASTLGTENSSDQCKPNTKILTVKSQLNPKNVLIVDDNCERYTKKEITDDPECSSSSDKTTQKANAFQHRKRKRKSVGRARVRCKRSKTFSKSHDRAQINDLTIKYSKKLIIYQSSEFDCKVLLERCPNIDWKKDM